MKEKCRVCRGTGHNMFDNSRCGSCNGTGEVGTRSNITGSKMNKNVNHIQ